MKKNNRTGAFALLIILLFTYIACEENNEVPDYQGTWTNVESVDVFGTGMLIPVLSTLKLSESAFEWVMAAEIINQFIDVAAIKGELSATGKTLTIRPSSMGMINDRGSMEWISKGDPGWKEELAKWEMNETNAVAYEIAENTLTLFMGDESIVFTRKE